MSETTIDWGRSWESANEEANKLRAERDALAAQLRGARLALRMVRDIIASDSAEYDDVRNAVGIIDTALKEPTT